MLANLNIGGAASKISNWLSSLLTGSSNVLNSESQKWAGLVVFGLMIWMLKDVFKIRIKV